MNSGVNFLRCLLMFMVVLHHSICHTSAALNLNWLPLFLVTVPAVDGFLVISGRYGVRFSWKKVLVISGQIVYYAVTLSALSFIFCRLGWMPRPVIAIGQAWYGVAYLALIFMSPILNAGIEAIIPRGGG